MKPNACDMPESAPRSEADIYRNRLLGRVVQPLLIGAEAWMCLSLSTASRAAVPRASGLSSAGYPADRDAG